jgi:hypothetical protein
MAAPFIGGCVCGAIRYEVTAEPIMMFNCHCRDCQRTTGSAFSPVVYVPAKAFKITRGSPRYYPTSSEMGGHINEAFAPIAARAFSVAALMKDRASSPPVLTILVYSYPKCICGHLTRSHGTRWIRRCRSLRNIRHRKTFDFQTS